MPSQPDSQRIRSGAPTGVQRTRHEPPEAFFLKPVPGSPPGYRLKMSRGEADRDSGLVVIWRCYVNQDSDSLTLMVSTTRVESSERRRNRSGTAAVENRPIAFAPTTYQVALTPTKPLLPSG